MQRTSKSRIRILDTFIDNLTMQETIELVDKYIQEKRPLHLMGVNADKINLMQKDDRLKQIVNSCEVINADGNSVVWASKVLGEMLPERVAGIDLMQQLIEVAAQRKYKVFLLGAKEEVVQTLADIYRDKYPDMELCGVRNGYFSEEQWIDIKTELERCAPQIVFVGITSPKKEFLVDYLLEQGVNSVFMGVGGSFDVLSGNIPRAPLWMQKIGMEWLFRVINEPRRLFKRYFVGNWKFIISVYKEKLKVK